MTDARISQIASIAVVQSQPPVRVSQVALVAPVEMGALGVRISQLVSIAVVEGPRVMTQSLDTVFKPPCFVPCVPFGVRRY